MNAKYFFILITSIMIFNCTTQNIPIYVGTYTNGQSEGIYKLDFNIDTGELTNKQLAVNTENPSFITLSPNKKFLFATGEGKIGEITAFKVNDDGKLTFINSQSSNGNGSCHVSVNEIGTKAVVSNYGSGNISIYSINENGSLETANQVLNHNEKDENPAHAHSSQFYKNELFVSDLGRNRLYHYKLVNNKYEIESNSIINIEGDQGPRHFTITKDGRFIYCINEYGSSIIFVKNTEAGFEQIDFDSTLDENYTGENKCADIHLSQDERFLYGSNRGENTIAVFKRNTETGLIDKIQNAPVHGDWPRNFAMDPTGKFLLVANQKSENISVFAIHKDAGTLTFLNDFKIETPTCIIF